MRTLPIARPGMNPDRTRQLMRAYFVALSGRLANALDCGLGVSQRGRQSVWLSPASVELAWHPGELTSTRAAMARADLRRQVQLPVSLTHVHGSRPEWWAELAIERLSGAAALHEAVQLGYSARPPATAVRGVMEALSALEAIWPAAAAEVRLLAPTLVYVGGGNFRSATFQQLFGVIFVGDAQCETLPATVEMLVHETAHLSLFLQVAFEPCLENPGRLVRHPLLDAPRPLEGAFHAAFALERMATVFARWCDTGPEEQLAEVRDRFLDALSKLDATLTTVMAEGSFTPAGERHFRFIVARLEQLRLVAEGNGAGRCQGVIDACQQ